MNRFTLFSTPHGSHLYGLQTPESDRDYYTVVSRLPHVEQRSRARYARQTIQGEDDDFVIDWSTWMLLCEKGVPQALEAMWSRHATTDLIEPFRASYRAHTGVLDTYLRTIKSFALNDDFKRRRHAARLAVNARTILHQGWFNPTLTSAEVSFVNAVPKVYTDPEELVEILRVFVFDKGDPLWE